MGRSHLIPSSFSPSIISPSLPPPLSRFGLGGFGVSPLSNLEERLGLAGQPNRGRGYGAVRATMMVLRSRVVVENGWDRSGWQGNDGRRGSRDHGGSRGHRRNPTGLAHLAIYKGTWLSAFRTIRFSPPHSCWLARWVSAIYITQTVRWIMYGPLDEEAVSCAATATPDPFCQIGIVNYLQSFLFLLHV